MGRHPNRETFERFYLTKVALGEGCGCAEHATRIRELETARAEPSSARSTLLLLPLTRRFHRAAQWVRSEHA
jgi:hypothetical protein